MLPFPMMAPGALDTTGETDALRQRALEALKQRNEQRRADFEGGGGIWMPYMAEREDPNRVWNTVLQGIQEAGEASGANRTKLRYPGAGMSALQGLQRVR